jgi:hypothetical protein
MYVQFELDLPPKTQCVLPLSLQLVAVEDQLLLSTTGSLFVWSVLETS